MRMRSSFVSDKTRTITLFQSHVGRQTKQHFLLLQKTQQPTKKALPVAPPARAVPPEPLLPPPHPDPPLAPPDSTQRSTPNNQTPRIPTPMWTKVMTLIKTKNEIPMLI